MPHLDRLALHLRDDRVGAAESQKRQHEEIDR
jgi:hypothetical protein